MAPSQNARKPPAGVVFFTRFARRGDAFVYRGLYYLPERISFPGLRRDTMSLFEYFFGERVFCPFPVGRPCLVRLRR